MAIITHIFIVFCIINLATITILIHHLLFFFIFSETLFVFLLLLNILLFILLCLSYDLFGSFSDLDFFNVLLHIFQIRSERKHIIGNILVHLR